MVTRAAPAGAAGRAEIEPVPVTASPRDGESSEISPPGEPRTRRINLGRATVRAIPEENTYVSKAKSAVSVAATVVTAAGVTVFGLSGPAQAATNHRWRDVATQRCLDSNTSGQVYTSGCNSGNFQVWTSADVSSPRLRDYATQLCLDSNTEGRVYTLNCNAGNFQHWQHIGQQWINVATGKCLDSNTDGKVYALECNGGAFQRWE
ncbi:RICIN domain-containing protein [Actinoplanes sp. NPDC051343]|uniref:RICIN domain-containing protein n=1 Tax=Actinoplanes sp. NPDC051343 TaxID=3363906 RepID=UPI0037A1021F